MTVELLDHTPPSIDRAFGNAEVVALLKKWLAIAEGDPSAGLGGKLNFMAVVATEPPRAAAFDFAGSIEMMDSVPDVIEALKAKIQERLKEQEPPPLDPKLDESYYCYSVTTQTVGFDFAYALIAAEMDRRRAGIEAPLKIGFWAGGSGRYGINTVYRAQMFEHVASPMLDLIGAVADNAAWHGRRGGFRLIDVTKGARAGEEVPRFKAGKKATMTVASWFLSGEKPVTITLRETLHYPHRNSDVDAALKFAKYLEAAGETVIIVRDTAKATEPLQGFATCPIASTDLQTRHALYEHAKMNFFVSNGCSACGWFGTAPFRQFINIIEGSPYFPETRWWWRDVAGIDVGEQLPWFTPQQKIVWEKDTYDAMRREWESRG